MTKSKAPKTLADFRAAHDMNVIVPAKIKSALAAMKAEHVESWAYEGDLMKRAEIGTTQVAMFREQFADHIVETRGKNPKRVWFADAKVAEKARAGVHGG